MAGVWAIPKGPKPLMERTHFNPQIHIYIINIINTLQTYTSNHTPTARNGRSRSSSASVHRDGARPSCTVRRWTWSVGSVGFQVGAWDLGENFPHGNFCVFFRRFFSARNHGKNKWFKVSWFQGGTENFPASFRFQEPQGILWMVVIIPKTRPAPLGERCHWPP